MGLKEQLMADYKTAMKEKNAVTKNTVNLVRAAIKQYEIDQQVTLEQDEDIVPIIKKQLKMRKDSLVEFEKAGREDLIEGCREEIRILEGYLPEEMSKEAVRAEVERIAESLGVEKNMKSMGMLMKSAIAELKGKADGSVISGVVKDFLSGK